MHKLVIAAALVVAFSAPALAMGKAEIVSDHRVARPGYEQQAPLPKGSVKSTQGQRQVKDPDWTPCDYTSLNDYNGCR